MVICQHHEDIMTHGDYEEGVCRLCGQITHYRGKTPTLVKLGRIDGQVVEGTGTEIIPQAQPGVVKQTSTAGSQKWDRERYQANKDEMISDLLALRKDVFLEKWKVTKGYLSHLKSDPLYKAKLEAGTVLTPKVTIDIPTSLSIPPLPSFQDYWPAETQIAWLQGWFQYQEKRKML